MKTRSRSRSRSRSFDEVLVCGCQTLCQSEVGVRERAPFQKRLAVGPDVLVYPRPQIFICEPDFRGMFGLSSGLLQVSARTTKGTTMVSATLGSETKCKILGSVHLPAGFGCRSLRSDLGLRLLVP